MIADIIKDAEKKMVVAVDFTKEEFGSIRTGRAHPAMVEKLLVEYYGAPTPLQQLATFQVPEARTLIVNPYDRSSVNAIEKAIRDSDLGVNPASDGNSIRCVLPALTEERRKEYIKMAKHKAEEGRVSVRNIRRHAIESVKRLEKDKEIGEDEAARAEKALDAATKKYVEQIDELLKAKEADLLEV